MDFRWNRLVGYVWAVGAVVACSFVGLAMHPRFDLVNIALVYLLAVVVIALKFSRGPAVVASALSVAAFDYLFVPPRGTFTVDDVQYLLTFAIMLAVALVITELVRNIRQQAAAPRRHCSGVRRWWRCRRFGRRERRTLEPRGAPCARAKRVRQGP